MPARVLFIATERFDPSCGERWEEFVAWSRLTQLRELISLDAMMCPPLFDEPTEADWPHRVGEDFKTNFFVDLKHLLGKDPPQASSRILASMESPTAAEVASFSDTRFTFKGFDLIDGMTGISALTNSGGFDRAFAGSELSECGLLTDHSRALEVQRRLEQEYPDEPHASCAVWAIWLLSQWPEA